MKRRFMSSGSFKLEDYLNIEALEDGLSFRIASNNVASVIYYSVDGGKFYPLFRNGNYIEINKGQIISLKSSIDTNFADIYISKKYKISGNISSINKSFDYKMFFQGQTNLVEVDTNFLPATTLIDSCYYNMFYGCTSLTTAPELPATTLTRYCYDGMFYGCSKLNYIKMLATDISATNCLTNWVSGVSSTGTFVKNPAMTNLPTGSSGIPSGWTVVNDGEEN